RRSDRTSLLEPAFLAVLSGCECHRLEVISQSLLKANYAFFSARLMLVADKQALSAFPYPLSRQKRSSLYVDKQALAPLFLIIIFFAITLKGV
uniref:hypothetical protein n=1 Tax=Staphylococcus epidermidis TaxID=1282 RepID=UPI001C93172E